ncbi:PR-1-like protein, partial [Pleomassaria siparia CBS 279.74]
EYTSMHEFQKAVLNVTNTYRRQHNATSVVWNGTLEGDAEGWGERCLFGHSGGPYGENLSSGYPNASASIEAWGQERVDYDFAKADFSHGTGHFTQLVWKATTAIGCSRTRCDGRDKGGAPGWYVVCEYWPRGNVIGSFEKNVQERVEDDEEPANPGQGEEPDEECMQGAL